MEERNSRYRCLKMKAAAAWALAVLLSLLSVFGGKITTYRRLAEEAVGKLTAAMGRPGTPWTATASLPGGDFTGGLAGFTADQQRAFPFLPAPMLQRLVRAYGSELPQVLGNAQSLADLGQDLGAGMTERELDWIVTKEWARSADDVLWRRSKLGLHMNPSQREALAARFQ